MERKTRLKQRLSRLLRPSAMLRNSCNSAASGSTFSPSSAAANVMSHDPLFIPQDSLFNIDRSLSLSSSWGLRSLDCSGGCRPTKAASDVITAAAKAVDSKKKETRVRETGELYEIREREARTCPAASPCKKKDKATANKKKKKKKKLLSNPYGFTSSSSDDDNGSEFCSSGNEDETEAFFSSRSFSSDSSEFYKRPSKNKNKDKKQSTTTTTTRSSSSTSRRGPPRRRMSFRPVVSVEEEERRSGIPVMKRSTDPYVDFCSSMVEMIVERQIFGARDLERLLHSYLSLNSPSHHSVIVRALADISRVLFGH